MSSAGTDNNLNIIILAPSGKGLSETAESLCSQKLPRRCKIRIYVSCPSSVWPEFSVSDPYGALVSKYRGAAVCEGGEEYEECLAAGLRAVGNGALLVCREGTVYSKKALRRLYSAVKRKAPAACLHTMTLRHTSSHLVKILHNPYEDYLPEKLPSVLIDLEKLPYAAHTAPDSYMFSAAAVKAAAFTAGGTELHDDVLHLFTMELLRAAGSFAYIDGEVCRIGFPLENSPAVFGAQHRQWWYVPSVRDFWIPYLNRQDGAPAFVQYCAAHHILSKIKCNFEDKDKGVLGSSADMEDFFDLCAEALMNISNSLIARWCEKFRWTGLAEARNAGFHRCMMMIMLRRKAKLCGGGLDITAGGGRLTAAAADGASGFEPVDLGKADGETAEIVIINRINGRLEIDASLSLADLLPPEDIKAYACCSVSGGEETRIPLVSDPVYPLIKCFGHTVCHKYNVHISLPAEKGMKCRFIYELGGEEHQFRLIFTGGFSRLVTGMDKAGWRFDKKNILYCPDGRSLRVKAYSAAAAIPREAAFVFSMLRYKGARKLVILGSLSIRMLYRLTKPFFFGRKRWITFDKLYKAGDNGDYFFRYAAGRKDGIKTYYILDKKAPEYSDMKKKYRRVLPAFTVRTMLTVLNSSIIAATHSTVPSYLGFPKPVMPFFRDLFNFRVACIQHGLTVQQIAQYQNRVFDNTELYCLASPFEYKNVALPIYGYSPEQLRITGLARFDGLVNDDRKFILITPTWRRNVVNAGIAHIKKSHSDAFKGSEYYRLYNDLINDPTLIETAKKTGYGITYLLHPAMSAQIDDFDRNGYVEIKAAAGDTSYERMLTQASLMVTDYSGVQFDFAYMRKPIVYYHPDSLPPQYETDSIDYRTEGFGEICTQHSQLVGTLCAYMKDSCRCGEEYTRRADSFFAYNDRSNCERIYNEIKKFYENG